MEVTAAVQGAAAAASAADVDDDDDTGSRTTRDAKASRASPRGNNSTASAGIVRVHRNHGNDDDDDDDDDDDNDIDSEKISDDENENDNDNGNENQKNQKNQKSSKAKSKDGSKSSDFDASLHKDILAFTFRVDIPMDLPHSVYATTCRYYYTANVLVKTATQQQILKRNFRVVMPVFVGNNNNNNNNNYNNYNGRERNPGDELAVQSSARVKVGQCLGLAHSNGLPCHLSATEIHRPKGQLVVQQSYNHNHNNHNNNNNNYYDVQTLRVSNTRGRPVCILTIVGSQTLSPGSRVHLQWDFPKQFRQPQKQQPYNHRDNNNNNNDNNGDRDDVRWIPCYQVCACLQGEEYAIYEDGSKKRTQSFLFDTCHEWVEPGVTDRVSKTLWLSSSSGGGGSDGAEGSVASHFEGGAPPCDLKTDVMEVSTWCRIDIAVCEQEETAGNSYNNNNASSGGGGGGAYNNLSLRIPCKVRHRSSFNCMQQQEQEMLEQQVPPLNELLDIEHKNEAFPIGDIRSDLKVLSLTMEDMVCGNDRATTSR